MLPFLFTRLFIHSIQFQGIVPCRLAHFFLCDTLIPCILLEQAVDPKRAVEHVARADRIHADVVFCEFERKALYDRERAERKAAEEAELKKKEEEERKAAAEKRKAEAAKKREEAAAKRKAEAEAKKAAEEAKAVTEAADAAAPAAADEKKEA